ncbi:MAG: hypothetical protein HDR02_08405 [Lachnospiraceae bacterium]|nr:hypothetical protein [Lachnospiraceae bacterium]
MSVKIKVSYEQSEELQQILCKLGQGVKSVRSPRQQAGQYKKAYIDFEVASTQKL